MKRIGIENKYTENNPIKQLQIIRVSGEIQRSSDSDHSNKKL